MLDPTKQNRLRRRRFRHELVPSLLEAGAAGAGSVAPWPIDDRLRGLEQRRHA
jgi:hypothetical protein